MEKQADAKRQILIFIYAVVLELSGIIIHPCSTMLYFSITPE
ncbi:hypothetical protein CIT292_06045 [Citrobacter youngae ATCC 29220]|uniref:Uncharacterized protein n=1 Tax=Citrobacter youngae ATCC 29220 TaxID=500640 RepID=D4B6V6_9ENTR|nr:hypothetical protein CIT292_06045 [Citrobacter youngae ATCC 29220]